MCAKYELYLIGRGGRKDTLPLRQKRTTSTGGIICLWQSFGSAFLGFDNVCNKESAFRARSSRFLYLQHNYATSETMTLL